MLVSKYSIFSLLYSLHSQKRQCLVTFIGQCTRQRIENEIKSHTASTTTTNYLISGDDSRINLTHSRQPRAEA